MKRIIITTLALALGIISIIVALSLRVSPPQATEVTASTKVSGSNHYTLIPASTLTANDGAAQLQVHGSGQVFVAYGVSKDVTAWLHGQRYTDFTVTSGTTTEKAVSKTAPAVANVSEDPVLDPRDADLWVDQRSATNSLNWTLDLPKNMSVLIAGDGSDVAPANISLTWQVTPVIEQAPVAVITLLIIGGLAGLVVADFYVFPFVVKRLRRMNQRQLLAGTAVLIAPVLAAGYLFAPAQAAQAATTKTTSSSLTDTQATRILGHVADTVKAADADLDAMKLAARVTGAALTLRETAYALHKKDKANALPAALPTGSNTVKLVLSQATDAWPRTLFAIVSTNEANATPQALTLRQDTPRGDYKLINDVELQPGAQIPTLPGSLDGTTRLSNTASVLRVSPSEITADYGDVLQDAKSLSANLFDTANDPLYEAVGPKVKAALKKSLGATASIAYSNPTPVTDDTVALSTAGSSAIVSVYLQEEYTTTPKMSGVSIKPSGKTRQLLGIKSTKTGISTVYGYQLLFVDPASGSGKLQLLGYSGGLISASELPAASTKSTKN